MKVKKRGQKCEGKGGDRLIRIGLLEVRKGNGGKGDNVETGSVTECKSSRKAVEKQCKN